MAKKTQEKDPVKEIVVNRKARHDYQILSRIEAGIVLCGSEVKALREGKGQIRDSYAEINNGQVWLQHAHISEYKNASLFNHKPTQPRRLLLHRSEINKLSVKVGEKGLTLIPLRMYFNAKGIVKVELGLCKGKREYDKRETIRQRMMERDARSAMKGRTRS